MQRTTSGLEAGKAVRTKNKSFVSINITFLLSGASLGRSRTKKVHVLNSDSSRNQLKMRVFRSFSSHLKPTKGPMGSGAAISLDSINAHVKNASYAVRGPIVSRAQELAKTR